MEHPIPKNDQPCLIHDFATYQRNADKALAQAIELRQLMRQHFAGRLEVVNTFGHDVNNSVSALYAVTQLASSGAIPIFLINDLLGENAPRVDRAFQRIRAETTDETFLQKVDEMKATTDALFAQLQHAREHHMPAMDRIVSKPTILGTVGMEGQQGVWL